MKLHQNLKLPVEVKPCRETYKELRELEFSASELPVEFNEWLLTMNLYVYEARFFNSPPGTKLRLHLDGQRQNAPYGGKINLIFDSYDSTMNWFELKPGKEGYIQKNKLGSDVMYFREEECNVLHSAPTNSHCMFHGMTIHDMRMGDNNGKIRQCYSLIIGDNLTGHRVTYTELYKRLTPYFVDN